MEDIPEDARPASKRKMSFGATVRAVLWSFLGIRKGKDYEKDVEQLNPIHVIIAGIIGAILFITILILIVKSVVAK
ncbi:DUF2970 domain-containing protein [Undibacterium terreum]|uniref:Membrane protein n=1 Tax=Undibacterium terreum TaxID=1224302 RepID=A0A916UVD1_9BURK|nr:DUF2970 domain-containing protein [Undibacterium terreum]GGC88596.1 membrane protein [Undibacterium terreum]